MAAAQGAIRSDQGRAAPVRSLGLADVPAGGRDSGAPYGNEESSRPDWRYGYPPGYEPYPLYDQARSPWAVKDDAIRDRRS